MTFSLGLLFRAHSKEELPGPPLAQIYVKNKTEDMFITSNCFSLKEIEAEIDRLKNELESIGRKAKRKFANIKKQ